jgi:superfamily II DNA or RNA helicase
MPLLDYQVPHVAALAAILRDRFAALDASSTGTGKTFATVHLARRLGLRLLVVCPKSVLLPWWEAAAACGAPVLGLSNYESLKGCRWYTSGNAVRRGASESCPLVARTDRREWRFALPPRTLVVLDEAHRCKNAASATCALMRCLHAAVARGEHCRTLLLSATLADKVACFAPFGVVLGLYEHARQARAWLAAQPTPGGDAPRSVLTADGGLLISLDDDAPDGDAAKALKIHAAVFPRLGARMRISELGDRFPANQVTAQAYALASHTEVQRLYERIRHINALLRRIHSREQRSSGTLGALVLCLQRIEVLKAPLFAELARDALEQGLAVAIFVKFGAAMDQLCAALDTDCVIRGGQSIDERAAQIERFQCGASRVIVCNIQAGGVSVSLHAVHPRARQRMSIISPTWSGQDMVQVLGRIHRAGSRFPALQRLVFVAGTYEEAVCQTVQAKLDTLGALNDGSLEPFPMDRETVDRVNASA